MVFSRSPFTAQRYRPTSWKQSSRLGARYRRALQHHPHLLFGVPFVGAMLAMSFLLTPVTALRYERHDRKVRQLSEEDALGLGRDRRRVDMKDEYYRLMAKDLDNWENKRVERLKGEPDGVL